MGEYKVADIILQQSERREGGGKEEGSEGGRNAGAQLIFSCFPFYSVQGSYL